MGLPATSVPISSQPATLDVRGVRRKRCTIKRSVAVNAARSKPDGEPQGHCPSHQCQRQGTLPRPPPCQSRSNPVAQMAAPSAWITRLPSWIPFCTDVDPVLANTLVPNWQEYPHPSPTQKEDAFAAQVPAKNECTTWHKRMQQLARTATQ